ncbi:acetyl/propionyl-CoA carboxylase alpha subunit/acetyl-CoA carboxylase carboxyltransferase component [Povalibacter uvarum]|uniref:Acetyl/propionyl-CoA carboxylase alpha subunit/acetyl-CoA carboxylase carboxyltransferase component n=1 Tax=Povalibacter uvarum TaxID=732238 RepID=A0A841HKS6_9GAMM|nr:carboxyl transferase domain-containing protein [Povalibacter uvarum]MBB6093456.1 acetyl/propionyl-CoA carboxylase alpha subunit/acetyl-CoA carboxylase carboxyltransferase component [Povalibacter uvarum]
MQLAQDSEQTLLIANRGEIAIRIARAAAAVGMRTIAIYSEDDARSLHVRRCDDAIALSGKGARAYLDSKQIIDAALARGCNAIHPGYGFLSESAAFAAAVRDAGLTFVGPRTDLLALFGDKTQARSLARSLEVPVPLGTFAAASIDDIARFRSSLPAGTAIVIKASGGGGGRGMRVVTQESELQEAYARCRSEAKSAFGVDEVYVEEYFPSVRHLEVQILGDAAGNVSHLWERECTIQRRHQKLVEIAPSPGVHPRVRDRVIDAALRMARHVRYDSLGTFEFLVDAAGGADARFVFIETNARLQVEHTVTEEILGIDLVEAQLRVASGATLPQLELTQEQIPQPRGASMQLRINMEAMQPDGSSKPTSGNLAVFEPPSGRGIRVDTFGYAGYAALPGFDPLLAKVIVHSQQPGFNALADAAYRALCEFRVEGVTTNLTFLQALLQHPEFIADRVDTQFIARHGEELLQPGAGHPRRFIETPATALRSQRVGAQVDSNDPLAVLAHGKQEVHAASQSSIDDDSPGAIKSPLQGTIVSIDVREGDLVHRGQQVLVIESMKMEHALVASVGGRVMTIAITVGDTVVEGATLVALEPQDVDRSGAADVAAVDLDLIRPDLLEVLQRHEVTLDAARPEAVARRRATKQRTARENIDDLCDQGTFVEYGPLVLAAQRARRSLEELIVKSPADGMVAGVGRINGALFPEPQASSVVMSYDYTVFAGTQGARNHIKTDRMIQVAKRGRMPVVIFTEGGGGRPGDTETSGDAGGTPTFADFAELSGTVPLVGIASGRCFAGNASLLGCCDVVIATANANIGMGGPAMVEGGGLGVFKPEEIGPISVQLANGVVDIGVADEAQAVRAARQYLSYFQGTVKDFECSDQRQLRHVIPENRLRAYEVRRVIDTLSDTACVLELRSQFARGMITSLIRIEGMPVGVIANNPQHLGGAIDADGADKAARFMQLCDSYDIPILFLCDTPGIMVGPEIEKTALVRHSSRMFVIGANLSVPFFTIVLRKAYGLGAIAMAGGSFKRPMATVAWPTGEFGGMGLEGAVKLAYRNELAQIADPIQRRKKYDEMVAKLYEQGKALSISTIFGVDDTIDPADSRRWLVSLLKAARAAPGRRRRKRPGIDSW